VREQFLTTLPMLDMRRDQRYNVPGSKQFLPGQSAGPHLIFADPWSKEWGQPHNADFQILSQRLRLSHMLVTEICQSTRLKGILLRAKLSYQRAGTTAQLGGRDL